MMASASPLIHLSPSQAATYRDCQRKWAFSRITAKVPNKYAERGLVLHDIAEAFLTNGTPPPDTEAGIVFCSGIKHLPVPGTGLCEGKFDWEIPGENIVIHGRKDWRGDPRLWPDALANVLGMDRPLNAAGTLDHKSTSNFKWALTPATIKDDIQVVTYLKHEQHSTGADVCAARWLYYLWKPKRPKSMPVDWIVGRDELEEKWAPVLATYREMAELKRSVGGGHVEPNSLPYDTDSCEKYGGCPFRDPTLCKITNQERMRAVMNQMSLKDKLAARAAGGAPVNPPAPAPVPAPVPAAPAASVVPAPTAVAPAVAPDAPTSVAGNSILDRLKTRGGAAPQTQALPPQVPAVVTAQYGPEAPTVPAPGPPVVTQLPVAPTPAESAAAVTPAPTAVYVIRVEHSLSLDLIEFLQRMAAK